MSRVIAAYDLDEDHGRLWVNAHLKRMPDIVIVANQPMDMAQTVTYVPEARLLEAMDAGVCKVESSVAIEFNTLISPDYYEFEMSCGSRFSWSEGEPPDYCPGCGRKVVHGGS